jgi:hypothetical protein
MARDQRPGKIVNRGHVPVVLLPTAENPLPESDAAAPAAGPGDTILLVLQCLCGIMAGAGAGYALLHFRGF